MAVIAVALGAAVAALLVVLLALLAHVRRLRRSGDVRIATAVDELHARMDAIVAELQDALREASDEGRRSRFLGDIGGSIDLDDVLTRVLEAALAAAAADAALLSLDGEGGPPVVATLGLSADEAERHAIAAPPGARDFRSAAVAYRYSDEEAVAATEQDRPVRAGLAVPIPCERGRIGTLAVFSRAGEAALDERAVGDLEQLARRAGPAIENARRFREARQLADLDALTGLHNRRYFHETLAREVARAQRYDRRLALIVFDLDDFKTVNDRVGHLAGDAVLSEVAERVRAVVRSADVACRIGGDEFAVIMPESAAVDAEQLSERLQETVATRPVTQIGHLDVSAGVAELRPADDAASLFERADEALYRAKAAGKGCVVVAGA